MDLLHFVSSIIEVIKIKHQQKSKEQVSLLHYQKAYSKFQSLPLIKKEESGLKVFN